MKLEYPIAPTFLADGFHRHFNRAIFRRIRSRVQRDVRFRPALPAGSISSRTLLPFGPLIQRHHIVKTPANDVDHRLFRLATPTIRSPTLIDLLFAAGPPATNEVNDGIIVIHLQHRADTFRGQAHFGDKLCSVLREKIIRMWVDFTRKAVIASENTSSLLVCRATNSGVGFEPGRDGQPGFGGRVFQAPASSFGGGALLRSRLSVSFPVNPLAVPAL